jgi:drug/metabolite transporter (DMT)-like permease
MKIILLLIILYGVFSAASVVITGDRRLISGNLTGNDFLRLIVDWRFILAMILAVGSRFTFIFINNSLLKIPDLAKNSTTITTFITASSYIFIIAANFIYLQERLTLQQSIGTGLVLAGIIVMMS